MQLVRFLPQCDSCYGGHSGSEGFRRLNVAFAVMEVEGQSQRGATQKGLAASIGEGLS